MRVVSRALAPVTFAMVAVACGQPPLEPRDPTPGVAHYKVGSFNVELRQYDNPDTVRAIGRGGADFIALQEVTPNWQTVLHDEYVDDYPYMMFRTKTNDDSAGLAVLSKFPLTDLGLHQGPNHWHPAWHVMVHTPAGDVQLLNVHLRAMFSSGANVVTSYLTTSDDHREEIQLFSANCEGEVPTVVLGDFNEEPSGAAVEFLEHEGYRNILPLFRPGQFTWRKRSIAGELKKTLDHVLFNDAFSPLDSWVVNKGGSDHIPVMAHLEAAYQW